MIRPITLHITSQKGHRDENEDSHAYQMNLAKDGTAQDNRFAPVDFFGVFDGHGPDDGTGHMVSQYIPSWIRALYMNKQITYPIEQKVLDHYYESIQRKVIEALPKISEETGSTAIVGVRYYDNGEWFQVVNLGDCRAVLSRNGIAMNLSKDHKPCWPYEKLRILQVNATQGLSEPIYRDKDSLEYRVKGLSVCRGFGDTAAKPHVSHIPDSLVIKLERQDKFIIIACDGLWEVMTSEEAVNFVTSHLTGLDDHIYGIRDEKGKVLYPVVETHSIAKRLALHAIAKGSGDNVTIMIIVFG